MTLIAIDAHPATSPFANGATLVESVDGARLLAALGVTVLLGFDSSYDVSKPLFGAPGYVILRRNRTVAARLSNDEKLLLSGEVRDSSAALFRAYPAVVAFLALDREDVVLINQESK